MIDIKIYKLIGEIHNIITSSKSSDEALKKSLKFIVDLGFSNHSSLWYLNEEKEAFCPYYWLCPIDLTNAVISSKKGVFAEVFKSKNTIIINDLKKEDEKLSHVLNGLNITSMVVVPFSNQDKVQGVITISKDKNSFTEDEIEICNILILLIDTLIKEKFVPKTFFNKNKIISVKNVTKDFENNKIVTKVLKGVNFDIFEGEFVVLLGESGCGKSTLLNILGGMDKPTNGEVIFEGKDIAKISDKELTEYRRNNIGFIFQSYNLMPNLTAKENLDLIGELVENPKDSIEMLDLIGLKERKNNYPSELSGGQQQRVSIARALVKNPKIIMADEPTAALDYETSIEVLTALENVIKTNVTLIMVTHNEEIAKMADRVIRIRDGKIYEITLNAKKAEAKDLVW